ncbi:hypothetical protein Tco_1317070 [Tanacetum coccineum]
MKQRRCHRHSHERTESESRGSRADKNIDLRLPVRLDPNQFMDDVSDEGDAHEDAADPINEQDVFLNLTIARPNISYVVHKLSQVMHAPKMSDMKVAFEVLRCIEHSPGKGIQYSKSKDFQVNAFVDSDWPSALQPSQSLDICNVSWKVSCFMEK